MTLGAKKLKRLGIDPALLQKLERHNITSCKDVLSRTQFDLFELLNIPLDAFTNFISIVSIATAPKPRRANELSQRFLRTSLDALDKALRGGFAYSTLSEIVGPSGSGKTQFCLMLSIVATLPIELGGLNGSMIYIDTESTFSATRLVEIATSRFPNNFSGPEELKKLTSKVIVFRETTCAGLLQRIQSLEETITANDVKLIILDSVASLVRKEYDTASMLQRTDYLAKEASLLKYLSESFDIPVVVTNQVTTTFAYEKAASNGGNNDQLEKVEGHVTAALGNTWSHSVNTRLIFEYITDTLRRVKIAKSPIAPISSFTFSIQQQGIVLANTGACSSAPLADEHDGGEDDAIFRQAAMLQNETQLQQHELEEEEAKRSLSAELMYEEQQQHGELYDWDQAEQSTLSEILPSTLSSFNQSISVRSGHAHSAIFVDDQHQLVLKEQQH